MDQSITPEEFMVLHHASKNYPLKIVIPDNNDPDLRRHNRKLMEGHGGIPWAGRRLDIARRMVERGLLRQVERRTVERRTGGQRTGIRIMSGTLHVFDVTELGEQVKREFVPPNPRYVDLAEQSWEW